MKPEETRRSVFKYCICAVPLISALVAWTPGLHAEGETEAAGAGTDTSRDPELNERIEKSVDKACQWLAKNQNRDGSLKSEYPCESTALAGLAWLAAGSTPQEGVYS